MRIWNQWVTEGHTEQHEGSQRPSMTNTREDRHIMRSALQNRITTSLTISQEHGHVYNTLSFRLFGSSTFAAAWPVNLETITSAFLDNVAYIERGSTLMRRTTKLDTEMAQWGLFRQVPVLHAVSSWSYTCLEAPRRPHVACLHSISAWRPLGVMTWATIGYTTRTSLVGI